MKKIYLSLAVALMSVTAISQSTLPNASFDNWTGTDPDDWTTSNQYISVGAPQSVFQDAAYPGSTGSSIKLENFTCASCVGVIPNDGPNYAGDARITIPFSADMDSIRFQIKLDGGTSADSAFILFAFSQGTTLRKGIAATIGYQQFAPLGTWINITAPLATVSTGAVDNLTVNLRSSERTDSAVPVGNSINIDNIYFIGGDFISVNELNKEVSLTVYPNPTAEQVTVSTDLEGTKTINIINMQGQIVKREVFMNDTETYDVSDLANGTYILTVSQNGFRVKEEKLIIAK